MPDVERLLRDLLASIHGDGGHYTEKFGVEQATEDARLRWYRAVTVVERAVTAAQGLRGAVDEYNDPEYRERQKLAAALDKDDPL